jgi:hypothetical protein
MKLWTAVLIEEAEEILSSGLSGDLYHGGEVLVSTDQVQAAIVAEEGDFSLRPQAFRNNWIPMVLLEITIPDGRLDEYLAVCLGSMYDEYDSAAYEVDEAGKGIMAPTPSKESLRIKKKAPALFDKLDKGQGSIREILDLFGYACVGWDAVIPPEMIREIDPATVLK